MKTCAKCFTQTEEFYTILRYHKDLSDKFKSWQCPSCGGYTFLRGNE